MDTISDMTARLGALNPQHLEIEDESARHAGHAGAKSGGGRYKLTIISAAFAGENALGRHRRIYAALGDLMTTRIHALAITALTPDEL